MKPFESMGHINKTMVCTTAGASNGMAVMRAISTWTGNLRQKQNKPVTASKGEKGSAPQ